MQTRANKSDFVGHFARCILILCKDMKKIWNWVQNEKISWLI